MTRRVNTKNIRRSTSKNVIICTFCGEMVDDMLDCIKPSSHLQPAHIIIHVGTNDLRSSELKAIIENISKLCDKIYNFCPKIDITLVQIITQLNNLLHDLCEERNVGLISHENIDERCLHRFGLNLHW